MNYNFDEIIDRRHTNSYKWDKYSDPNILPVWVADMDFRVAQPIIDSLQKITEHGLFGYSKCPDELPKIITERLLKQHNWHINPDWIVWLPGLVPGLGLSIRALTDAGQSVMTATPVYHHFMSETLAANRGLTKVPLIERNNRLTLDFETIEASIDKNTRLFLLCNPHNPAGTVFTKNELRQLHDICSKNNVLICADEIHCDLILDDTKQHHSLASFGEAEAQNTITLLAPSKTFNIAGLGCSFAVIPNDEVRHKFVKTKASLMPMLSIYAYEAGLAAYKYGEDWRMQLLAYLRGNHDYLLKEINNINGLRMLPLEATYLAWIDARASGLDNIAARLEAAGVGISDGAGFEGNGFFRLNFACPRGLLEEVVARIKTVF